MGPVFTLLLIKQRRYHHHCSVKLTFFYTFANINEEQRLLVSRFKEQHDNYKFWSGQVKAMLESKHVWQVVLSGKVPCSTLHKDNVNTMKTGAEVRTDDELAKGEAYSVILQNLGKTLFSCVVVNWEDLQKT